MILLIVMRIRESNVFILHFYFQCDSRLANSGRVYKALLSWIYVYGVVRRVVKAPALGGENHL
jgi:hypothetical protein